MNEILNYPLVVFACTSFLLGLAAAGGVRIGGKRGAFEEGARDDFAVILAAALTLLGLIIGFSFSMAIGRYDQRKNLEEAEANAIGTEYVRADLLSAGSAPKVRALLKEYIDQRILFYTTRDQEPLHEINRRTAQIQTELWAAVREPATAQPTPVMALVVAGMNDVLNAAGYTQAAWWNRIPHAAWVLMAAIAVCCNFLIGYGVRNRKTERRLLLILPVVVAISFQLIADIDSPRGGLIHVAPQNLRSLADSLRSN